jgi:hypothetical protein
MDSTLQIGYMHIWENETVLHLNMKIEAFKKFIFLNSRKYTNNWRLSNMLPYDQWVIEEIREEIKEFLEFNKNERQPTRTYGTQQRQS